MPSARDEDYAAELKRLREALLSMAGHVERMFAAAFSALMTADADAARAVVAMDAAVNEAEVDIDDLCVRILAARQPTGSELRFITRAIKMVTDLERVGDLAVNVAERAIDLAEGDGRRITIHPGLERMAQVARIMVGQAIDAFVDHDRDAAREVIAMDDEIDDLYGAVFRGVLEQMNDDPSIVHAGIHVQSAAKFLERIGDHATNLAEQVVFMVDGRDIRHGRSDLSSV